MKNSIAAIVIVIVLLAFLKRLLLDIFVLKMCIFLNSKIKKCILIGEKYFKGQKDTS